MLSYLITSEVRKRLLRLLWIDGLMGSVSELSRVADVGFASAYQELKQMEEAGLALSKAQGKTLCFSANKNYENSSILKKLLEIEGRSAHSTDELTLLKKISAQDLLLNLVQLGLPLGLTGKPHKVLSLESSLAGGLRLSHQNATLTRTLPVVFYRNKDHLDLQRLVFLANRLEEKQALGFFLDLTFSLSNFTLFHRTALNLRDKRVKKQHSFFEQKLGLYSQIVAKRNTPPLAKKWYFVMNIGMDSFEEIFRKFCKKSI